MTTMQRSIPEQWKYATDWTMTVMEARMKDLTQTVTATTHAEPTAPPVQLMMTVTTLMRVYILEQPIYVTVRTPTVTAGNRRLTWTTTVTEYLYVRATVMIMIQTGIPEMSNFAME
jgi:hypothetical protein